MNFIKTIAFFLCASMLVAQTVPLRNPQIQGASGSIISGATLTNNGTLVNAATLTNSGTISGAGTFNLGSGTVTLPASSVTSGNITDGAIVNADINASAAIDISKLASSAITIAGTSTSLGGSITASAILDSISSTQGTILYRGASGWVALSPGTSGHFLKTQGANANPMWDAAAGSGSVATDAIWDAAGDLVVGTGANTAARLAIGANGYVLTSNGTTASWAAAASGISGLTSARVPFATGATTLGDDADLTFATDTLSGTALKINVTATTAATSSTTGALIVAGGIGANKDSWINGIRIGRGGGNVSTNIAVGGGAITATATGVNNTAVGESALSSLLGGGYNTMLGHEAGWVVTAGLMNTGIGNQVFSGLTTGDYNVSIGATSLGGVTTANDNTALGYQAGTYRNAGLSTLLANPSGGIYIGNNAIGYADSEANAIVIGNAAIGEGSNTTVIGNSSTTNARIYGQLYGYPINVKSYGAKGDARKVADGVLTGSSTTVTSATASFTAADVGKVIWGNQSDGTNSLPQTTIATYVNSTTVTVTVAPGSSWTGTTLVLGTDDTTAIQAAITAVEALPNRGSIFVPAGGYITTATPFVFTAAPVNDALPSIIGEGSGSTIFYPSPQSTNVSSAFVFNYDTLGGRKHMQGFCVDSSNSTFTSCHIIYFSSSANYNTAQDVRTVNALGNFSSVYIGAKTTLTDCFVESGGIGVYGVGEVILNRSYVGNCTSAAVAISSASLFMSGGILDESGGGTVVLVGSSATMIGVLAYGLTDKTVVDIDGTSTLRAVDCNFMPFDAHNNVTGLDVASGGVARLSQCRLTGTGTGFGLVNAGTVYDGGNNTVNTTSGTAMADGASSIRSVANGGTGASSLSNLITLGTMTTGNYVADVAGTSNEITSTHTPGEGSTATLSLPATIDLGGKTSFEIPNGAAPTVDAFGEIAGDNDLWAASRGAPVFFDGTAATALVNVLVSDAPSNGQVPKWNTGGTITWEADNSGGTISGTDTQVMFFDGTDTPAGDAGMTYNKTTNVLTAAGFVGALTGNASTVTTNANMTGDVTSSGSNATTLAAISGSGPLLAENASIRLDPAGSADGKYTGITVTGTAGATLAFGDVVVLDVTDSRWELADANSAAAADGDSRALLGICVLAAASDGSATTILLQGIVRADTAFPALTVGAPVYVGETAGDAVVTQPTTADVVIRVIGHALTADEMFFNPDLTWITHL